MAKKETIQIKYDSDKLRAIKMQMAEKGLDFDKEMLDTINRLYDKYVPTALKKFIDDSMYTNNQKGGAIG